jgi:4-hydroxy-tetrahydrodipicolinate reductase
LREAIRVLGPGFDVEIVETHHRKKADAPSGTAMRLADIAQASRSGPSKLVMGREGKPGARKSEEVGVLAVRGGDVVGDHVVHLLGEGERIELVHRASNRDLFASGALRAARWLRAKNPGRYGLADVFRT